MRPSEIDYWDRVAKSAYHADGSISDNWLKRQVMMGYFTKYTWLKERVLEIGTGAGLSAALLKISCGGLWSYIGTDMSTEFCETAHKLWKLKVVQGDVLNLPEGKFTRILALDSLEHVRPEDRPQGYDNISDRLEKGGVMFINIPLTESYHEGEFDHGFNLADLVELEKRGLVLRRYETYQCHYIDESRMYAMAVLSK